MYNIIELYNKNQSESTEMMGIAISSQCLLSSVKWPLKWALKNQTFAHFLVCSWHIIIKPFVTLCLCLSFLLELWFLTPNTQLMPLPFFLCINMWSICIPYAKNRYIVDGEVNMSLSVKLYYRLQYMAECDKKLFSHTHHILQHNTPQWLSTLVEGDIRR